MTSTKKLEQRDHRHSAHIGGMSRPTGFTLYVEGES
jgi:hypothetical protein